MSDKTFIAKCVHDEALLTEIDDYIDKWHETEPEAEPLHDFLGMSWEEYAMWVAEPEILPYIVTAHSQKISLVAVLEKDRAQPAAKGVSTVAAKRVFNLLKDHGKLHP